MASIRHFKFPCPYQETNAEGGRPQKCENSSRFNFCLIDIGKDLAYQHHGNTLIRKFGGITQIATGNMDRRDSLYIYHYIYDM